MGLRNAAIELVKFPFTLIHGVAVNAAAHPVGTALSTAAVVGILASAGWDPILASEKLVTGGWEIIKALMTKFGVAPTI